MNATFQTPRRADLPSPAYDKALDALRDYESAAEVYTGVLDAVRVLVAGGRFEAAVDTLDRGTAAVQIASRAGQRLGGVRDALVRGTYDGPRAAEIGRRIAAGERRGSALAAATSTLAARCALRRNEVSDSLGDMQSASSCQSARVRAAYGAGTPRGARVVNLTR